MNQNPISIHTLKRLPLYLDVIQQEMKEGKTYISAPTIAKICKLSDMQVKKDLSYVKVQQGIPKKGYVCQTLAFSIKEFLGYNDYTHAILVGVGHLGKALLNYEGFQKAGIEIVCAFDKEKSTKEINQIKVLGINQMEDLCKRMNVHIGIITTSKESAQEVCNQMVKSGIKAIWNFAPISLHVPSDIIVQNENMASNLAVLSRKLSEIIIQEKEGKTDEEN